MDDRVFGLMKRLVENHNVTSASIALAIEAIERGATGRQAFNLVVFEECVDDGDQFISELLDVLEAVPA